MFCNEIRINCFQNVQQSESKKHRNSCNINMFSNDVHQRLKFRKLMQWIFPISFCEEAGEGRECGGAVPRSLRRLPVCPAGEADAASHWCEEAGKRSRGLWKFLENHLKIVFQKQNRCFAMKFASIASGACSKANQKSIEIRATSICFQMMCMKD